MLLRSSLAKRMGACVLLSLLGACGGSGGAGGGTTAPEPTPASVAKSDQAVRFTSTPPTSPYVGGPTYEVTAEAWPSGLPVTLSLDVSSAGCALNGSTVSFTGTGTCVINADQPGDDRYNASPRMQQVFAVAAAPYTIDQLTWTHRATYFPGQFAGQNFLIPTTAKLERVEAYLQSAGTLRGEVYAVDASGAPTGAALATSDTVPQAATSSTATSLVFSTPATLDANTRYAVVIVGSTTWTLEFSSSDVYAGGSAIHNTIGTWTVIHNADIKFQLFMRP